jgi:His/Glu/Gln/Arg/opine family amino acid ABC transporter permease subunit
MSITTELDEQAAPPSTALHPMRWVKDNLFSSWWNTTLTIAVAAGILGALVGVLSFVFAPERQWNAVVSNIRLYATFAYPEQDYWRVWIALGLVVALSGLSVAAWAGRPQVAVSKVTRGVAGTGSVVLLLAALSPVSTGIRLIGLLVGLGLLVLAYVVRISVPAGTLVPLLGTVAVLLALTLAALWILPAFIGPMEIASTTTIPLTIQFVLGIASYLAGLWLRSRVRPRRFQSILVGFWLLSVPLIYLVILRAPAWDWDTVVSEDVPIWLVFIIGGSFLLRVVTDPKRTTTGGVAAAIMLLVTVVAWTPLVATWPWLSLYKVRIPLLVLALWALAAPSFSGSRESRRGTIVGWIGAATVMAFFLAAATSGSGLVIQTNFIGGLLLTLLLSIVGLLVAFPLGILLALGRTSTMPIFRVVSTAYIEVVRGVPLITILFFGALFLPLFLPGEIRIDPVIRALVAVSLFGAAYLAENVRGGLQAISKGQYEAAKAVGLNTVQMTLLIILPQALRAVIPALVGQAIAIFKDTSLVFIIGLTEILAVAQKVVPGQPSFVGSQRENLLFVAFVYWMFTFTFSRASQRLERKLGVGER